MQYLNNNKKWNHFHALNIFHIPVHSHITQFITWLIPEYPDKYTFCINTDARIYNFSKSANAKINVIVKS